MQSRWLSALWFSLGVAACAVPSFEVDPPTSAEGGRGSSGASSGSNATAGSSSGRAGSDLGGADTKPDELGGGGAGDGGAGNGGVDNGAAGNGAAGPVRIGFSVFSDSASGDSHASAALVDATFKKPTGTAPGDFMLLFFGADHLLWNLDAVPGWKLVDQHAETGTDGQGTYLLYRFADGSEPDPIVFQDINDPVYKNGVQGLLSVYRGVNADSPINAYETVLVETGSVDSEDVVTATPAITTSVDDCLLIAGLSPDSQIDAPVVTSWPEGFDDHRTSVTNPPAPYPYGWANIYAAERRLASAATVPPSSFGWKMTYGGTQYYGALSFIIALAPQ
jgi:hypothetical protein